MATELVPPPELTRPGSSATEGNGKKMLKNLRGSGRGSSPSSLKKATQVHIAGYDSIKSGPEKSLERHTGKEKTVSRESKFSEELVGRFKDTLHGELEKLINARKSRSAAEFDAFLNDSGHSYYKELFNRMVKAQEGTGGRQMQVDEKALDTFMQTDKGLGIAYQIKMQLVQEEAMGEGWRFGMRPNEPEDSVPERSDYTTEKGRPLWQAGRGVRRWWREKSGRINDRVNRPGNTPENRRPGRTAGERAGDWLPNDSRELWNLATDFSTRGRTVNRLALYNALAFGAGSAFGPVGAILGPAAVNIYAVGRYASRPGEMMRRNESADALRSFLGDPYSQDPNMRRANTNAIEWMQEMRNTDPNKYTITRRGNRDMVEERAGYSGMRGKTLESVEADIVGNMRDILAFQKDNNIPAGLRRPMDVSWLLEGSSDRPKHGGELEQKIMKRFNPDRGGILDRQGNAKEINKLPYIQMPVLEQIEVPVLDSKGDPMISGGFPVTEYVTVPVLEQAADDAGNPSFDAAGKPIMRPVMRRMNPNSVMGQERPVLQTFKDKNGKDVVGVELEEYEDIYGRARKSSITNRVIMRPKYSQPANAGDIEDMFVDPTNENVWVQNAAFRERNPDGTNNLDIPGNVERYRRAAEAVIGEEINDVFRSIVDGKNDYRAKIYDDIGEAKAARKGGPLVDAEKKKLSSEKEVLKKDAEALKNAGESLGTFQGEVGKIRKTIADKQKEQDLSTRGITIKDAKGATVANTPDNIRAALQDVLTEGSTTEIVINGESIKSVEKERQALEDNVKGQIAQYRTDNVDSAIQAYKDAQRAANSERDKDERARLQGIADAARMDRDEAESQLRQFAKDLRDSDWYKTSQAEINRKRKVILDARDNLVSKGTEISEEQDKLVSDDLEGRKEASATITKMEASFNKIKGWSSTPGVLDADNLAQGSYDSLLQSINDTYESTKGSANVQGWPASENSLADNRSALFYAMAEARAAKAQPAVQTKNAELTTLTQATQFNIAEIDLVSLTEDEIKALVADKRAANAALPNITDAQIKTVKEDVMKRVSARQTALVRVQNAAEKAQVDAEGKYNKLDTEGIATPKLDAIQRAVGRYGPLIEEIMEDEDDTTINSKFIKTKEVPVNPANPTGPKKTVADKDQVDDFYQQILDRVFKHSKDYQVSYGGKVGVDAALQRSKDILSETDLADAFEGIFGEGLAGANGRDRLQDAMEKLWERQIDKASWAEFLSENIIYGVLKDKISTVA